MRPRPGHSVQDDVEAFHRALDLPVGDTPAIRRPALRARLIAEEAAETLAAITGETVSVVVHGGMPAKDAVVIEEPPAEEDRLVEAIDGLCDLLCVIYGSAAEFGVDLAPFWDEVHRTNMAKQGGPVREDGKRLKPEGWEPPDLRAVLATQRRTIEVDAAGQHLPTLIARAFGTSLSEGRRLTAQEAVLLNGRIANELDVKLATGTSELQVGRSRVAYVHLPEIAP